MRRIVHNRLTVEKVLICLFRHPYRHIIRRWNWKAACLSAFSRGLLILLTNLSAGRSSAAGAMFAEVCYRVLTSGFYSSVTQTFRFARPVWAASLVSMALLPIISDTAEFIVHFLHGTERLGATVIASVIFTALSTLIELFVMRHGILVVGQSSKSLLQDIKSIPGLIVVIFYDFQSSLFEASVPVRIIANRHIFNMCDLQSEIPEITPQSHRAADLPIE